MSDVLDGVEVVKHPVTGAHMVRVRGGSYLMGSNKGGEFERPVHEVSLSDFFIDVFPVTNRSFRRFSESTGYVTEAERPGAAAWGYRRGKFQPVAGLSWQSYASADRDDHPVVLVNWEDALRYCEWAKVRLPTEAEWEFCARGGLSEADYPWGESAPDGTQSNFARTPAEVPPTRPVNASALNPLGVGDLVGNVWQWCSDWYGENYYAQSALRDPQGPETGRLRVRRGGSWNVIQGFRLRCSNRGAMDPLKQAPNVGFRAAASSI